jgi:hypothetical protein
MLFLAGLGACEPSPQPGEDFIDPSRAWAPPVDPNAEPHATEVHTTAAPGGLVSEEHSTTGEAQIVPCATCHSPTRSTSLASKVDSATGAHSDVVQEHGDLTCASCHSEGSKSLHLANGLDLLWEESMDLCSQCHGVQRRDYDHGSHGGMSGYWDLRQGPRSRNHCVDCHTPHSPEVAGVLPVHPPRDRFLESGEH